MYLFNKQLASRRESMLGRVVIFSLIVFSSLGQAIHGLHALLASFVSAARRRTTAAEGGRRRSLASFARFFLFFFGAPPSPLRFRKALDRFLVDCWPSVCRCLTINCRRQCALVLPFSVPLPLSLHSENGNNNSNEESRNVRFNRIGNLSAAFCF